MPKCECGVNYVSGSDEDGAALLQRLVPSRWWGRGDTFALQDTLDASKRILL